MFLKEKCVSNKNNISGVNNNNNIKRNNNNVPSSGGVKMRGKGGLLDFSHQAERNKENSFLDVDWVIKELLEFGRDQKIAKDVLKTPSPGSVNKSGSSGGHKTAKSRRVSTTTTRVRGFDSKAFTIMQDEKLGTLTT